MMYWLVIAVEPTGAIPSSSPSILANPSHVWTCRESKGCVRETCPITNECSSAPVAWSTGCPQVASISGPAACNLLRVWNNSSP